MKDCATVTLCGHDAFFKGKKPWLCNSEKKKAILRTPKRKISDNHIFFKGNETEMALCGCQYWGTLWPFWNVHLTMPNILM